MNNLLKKVEEFAREEFSRKEWDFFAYHDWEHTVNVVKEVKILADSSSLPADKVQALLIAAWFHDLGYVENPKNHENGSIRIAKSFLENNRILGHSILQVIKKENKYHIIECNARFGGASTLSYTLGLESFLWFFKECNQEDISPKISNKKIRQVRVSKDMYFES